jgi:murein DD-endopeptidase MepM/ murein hydrolase activator NlpD
MRKGKYKFNHETLSYEKIQVTVREVFFRRVLPHFTSAIILGIILTIFAFKYLDSPIERTLNTEGENIKLKYKLLNKKIASISTEISKIQTKDDEVYRLIFESDPVPSSIRNAGFGGTDKYKALKGYDNSDMLITTSKSLDIVSKKLVVQSESFDEVIELVSEKEKMLACIPAIQPISNEDLTRFGSPFGYRMHPILGYVRMHEGIDLTAPKGTPVYASGDGVVLRADANNRGYGNCVKINHGFSYSSIYAHLSEILVNPGAIVKRGDLIGLVGNSGLSTSPHLHYEVRIDNVPVNPVNFYYNDLTDEEYEQMIDAAATSDTHVFEW